MKRGLVSCPVSKNEHLARLHGIECAGTRIGFVVPGNMFLKLQRDPAAHDADTIDGIHQGLDVRVEDVAGQCRKS